MIENLAAQQPALSVIRGCLVATVQGDLDDGTLKGLRQGVIDRVHAASIKGVIFDMSAVRVLDSHMFDHVAGTARMVGLLGAQALFAGFQPGAVSALIDLEVDTAGLLAFRTTEDGIEHLAGAHEQTVASGVRDEEGGGERGGGAPDEDREADEPVLT